MLISLVSNTSLADDPRAQAEAESLRLAGHEVRGASPIPTTQDWITSLRRPGLFDRLTRRSKADRLSRLAGSQAADIYQPVHPTVTEISVKGAAGTQKASVLVKPGWPRPSSSDLIDLAPSEPWRSIPASGYTASKYVPGSARAPHRETEGTLVIAYRKTDRNPGRYLEAALTRAGLRVRHSETIDWREIDPATRGVVIVESPLPALPVRGHNPGIPVLFWVHHGEHHLETNVRLQRRYGAHAVLLAHSWHLSHRFSGIVDRLPFAVAPDIFPSDFKPHADRLWDIGFVGAISGDDSRYSRRERILRELRDELGADRVAHLTDVSPEQMAGLYRDSRVVIDDGEGRHLPITMRVFEATGAGALLFTRPGPGLDQLLEPRGDYLRLGPDIQSILETLREGTEEIARSGFGATWSEHTYDQRAADVLDVLQLVTEERMTAPEAETSSGGLASVVERFPDAQRILDLGGTMVGSLPGREVWDYHRAEERAERATFHVTAIAGGLPEDRARAIAAARTAVISPREMADALAKEIVEVHGVVGRHDYQEGSAFTFGQSGYRVGPHPDSL